MKSNCTLEPAYYLSDSIFKTEISRIFNNWQFVCLEQEIGNLGDTLNVFVSGKSILIRRNLDGEICAFYNSCPHRGGIFMDKCFKNMMRLRCMYHGWIYNDEGQLEAAPQFWDGKGLHASCKDLSLKSINIQTVSGLVFVCLSEENSSKLSFSSSSDIYSMKNTRFEKKSSYLFQTNWKLYVENWLENYHLGWVHDKLSKDVDISTYEVFVEDSRILHQAKSRIESNIYGGVWAWHWPNFAFNTYDIGYSIEIMRPIDVRNTQVDYYFVFHENASLEKKQSVYDMCKTVTQEDGQMCEHVQKNLESSAFERGPLSPIQEIGISEFHRLYRAQLQYT